MPHRSTQPIRLASCAAAVALVACAPRTPGAVTPEAAASSAAASGAAATDAPADAAASAARQEDMAAHAARRGADAWLSLVDHGRYAESWDLAAQLLQQSVSRERWEKALGGARGPLGDLSSRKLRAAEYKSSLAGAPAGKYVVVYYDTAFADSPSTSEIVTLTEAPDDSWKVAGYYVK